MNLKERGEEAIKRITSGAGCMRVPADPTDPDLVISELLTERDRLRALLERALLPIKGAVKEWKAPSDRELLADIRKELGK